MGNERNDIRSDVSKQPPVQQTAAADKIEKSLVRASFCVTNP